MAKFKKGNPGGPGRPKKGVALSDMVREVLNETHPTDKHRRTWLRGILETAARQAWEGDDRARQTLLSYGYGKPLEQVTNDLTLTVTHADETPVGDAATLATVGAGVADTISRGTPSRLPRGEASGQNGSEPEAGP